MKKRENRKKGTIGKGENRKTGKQENRKRGRIGKKGEQEKREYRKKMENRKKGTKGKKGE